MNTSAQYKYFKTVRIKEGKDKHVDPPVQAQSG